MLEIILPFLITFSANCRVNNSAYLFSEKNPELDFNFQVVVPEVNRSEIVTGKKFIGSRFNISYTLLPNSYNFSDSEKQIIDRAFFLIHWIIYNTDYLKEIAQMDFNTVSGRQVAARIKYTSYTIELDVINQLKDGNGNPVLGLAIPHQNRIQLNSNRIQNNELDAARTIFHEMIHNIGFVHSQHEFISIFGELLKKYYDRHEKQIDLEYQEFCQSKKNSHLISRWCQKIKLFFKIN